MMNKWQEIMKNPHAEHVGWWFRVAALGHLLADDLLHERLVRTPEEEAVADVDIVSAVMRAYFVDRAQVL